MVKDVAAAAISAAIRELRDSNSKDEVQEIAEYLAPMLNKIDSLFREIDEDYHLYFRRVNKKLALGIFHGNENIGFTSLVDCIQTLPNENYFKREGNDAFVWSPNNVYLLFEAILKILQNKDWYHDGDTVFFLFYKYFSTIFNNFCDALVLFSPV